MKTFAITITIAAILIIFISGYFLGRTKVSVIAPQLTLEQILSIRELHLVKHTYNDLFFLHRNNDNRKPIRAIVNVPVVVTAYINLKEIELVRQGDSVKQIILPRAKINEPQYEVDKMIFRETRSFQLHAGKDLYPVIGNYLQSLITSRIDSVKKMAVAHRILVQAEVEGKEYIEGLLKVVGRSDIVVSIKGESINHKPGLLVKKRNPIHQYQSTIEAIPFGYLPIRIKGVSKNPI
jgi:hypothetical protein